MTELVVVAWYGAEERDRLFLRPWTASPRYGGPPVLRMFVCPLPTCPSRLLTRSRASAGTIPAHAAAARSSRSAASIEDLSRTSDRVRSTKTALRAGAVSSHSDPWSS